jgi:hypothetical protein
MAGCHGQYCGKREEGESLVTAQSNQLPMANGYSSFLPSGYLEFQLQVVNFFPDRRQLCVFRSLGVTTLIN